MNYYSIFHPTGCRKNALIVSVVAVFGFALAVPTSAQNAIQSQENLASRIADHTPERTAYIKDRPILGWKIGSEKSDDIPRPIWNNLGEVDRTNYTAEYLAENIGSIIALQMTSDGPDFYVIGKETFDEKYEIVGIQNVIEKNGKLVSRLENVPAVHAMLLENNASLVGALKSVPVEMIELSDIGFEMSDEVTIQAPWGEQTKPEGSEGYLVWDTSENQYYMVNQGDDGNPLGYIPVQN